MQSRPWKMGGLGVMGVRWFHPLSVEMAVMCVRFPHIGEARLPSEGTARQTAAFTSVRFFYLKGKTHDDPHP